MKNKLLGLLLLVAAVSTYVTLLIGNMWVAMNISPILSTVTGILGVITVGWQVKLAFNKLGE